MIYAAKKRFNYLGKLKILGQWKTNTSLCRRSMISSKMMLTPPQRLFFQMKLSLGRTSRGMRVLNTLMNYVLRTWWRSYSCHQLLFILRTRVFNTSFLRKGQGALLKVISFLFFLRQYYDKSLLLFLYPAIPFPPGR